MISLIAARAQCRPVQLARPNWWPPVAPLLFVGGKMCPPVSSAKKHLNFRYNDMAVEQPVAPSHRWPLLFFEATRTLIVPHQRRPLLGSPHCRGPTSPADPSSPLSSWANLAGSIFTFLRRHQISNSLRRAGCWLGSVIIRLTPPSRALATGTIGAASAG